MSMDTTRVAVVTFADEAEVWVDQVTSGNIHEHKCSLLGTSLPNIDYALVLIIFFHSKVLISTNLCTSILIIEKTYTKLLI